jgi:hypothetical protein
MIEHVPPLAHAGHWIVGLVYAVPPAGILAWLGLSTWRERRRGDDADEE